LGGTDDKNETVFQKHVSELRYAMDLADVVEAKLNIETEKSFAIANQTWGLYIIKEIRDRVHGVQTHCDLRQSYTSMEINPLQYSQAFKENKDLVNVWVGAKIILAGHLLATRNCKKPLSNHWF